MPPSTNADLPPPATSHEEAWVAHAALLDAGATAAAAGDETPPQCRPRRHIECGRALDADGVELLRDALIDYLGDAPVRDRAPGRSLLRRVDAAVEAAALEPADDAGRIDLSEPDGSHHGA
jgi:hypothetical protein